MIEYIKAVYPLDYDYFVESDLGMMLIELVAYMGAVMSMKADMLANENFLLTARNRNSVKKLLELIGVRLRGPLAAAAQASLTVPTYGGTGSITIPVANRTTTVTSPEDGASLAYTLYKVTNGIVDSANSTGDIVLAQADQTGGVWSNLVLQEGALITDEGEFAATESIKSVPLTQSPVIEASVQVYITSPSVGSNTQKCKIYSLHPQQIKNYSKLFMTITLKLPFYLEMESQVLAHLILLVTLLVIA